LLFESKLPNQLSENCIQIILIPVLTIGIRHPSLPGSKWVCYIGGPRLSAKSIFTYTSLIGDPQYFQIVNTKR
jgi:hypothetical protein